MGWKLDQLPPHLRTRVLDAAHKQSRDKASAPIVPTLTDAPKRKSRGMNKTETAFSQLLQAKMNRGEIVSFDYEGMSLRWSGMTYTPDFVAVEGISHLYPIADRPYVRLIFYEVKGAHIYSRDMVRFKGARGNYPLYEFQMWQLKKGDWTRLL